MSALVYQAINAVSVELAETGIAKRQRNEDRDYAYRGIDDLLHALAPLLSRHKLCVLPRVVDRHATPLTNAPQQLVVVRVEFDLVSAIDGSKHVVGSFGEAMDDSDKGTAKAMSAAYKSAMLQAFCIPVPQEDSDATSPRLNPVIALPEPPEGWESWADEVGDIAKSCESIDAIDRLMSGRRGGLAALQRSRPELYAQIGEVIANRLAEIQKPSPPPVGKAPGRKSGKRKASEASPTAAAA